MKRLANLRKPWRGFTLIELLVVIAIIAILAAILFPVFAKVRENARKISCASNLKQIGTAIVQYNQDADETYPLRYFNRNGNPTPYSWRQAIQPFIKSAGVFRCPSNTIVNPNNDPNNLRDAASGSYPEIPAGYGYNARLGNDDLNPPDASLASVNAPSTKIMVAEEHTWGWNDFGSPWWGNCCWDTGFAGHISQMNLLFIDGHVKSMRPTQTVSDPAAATQFNMWGSMDDGSTAGCGKRDINCDSGSTSMLQGLGNLANNFK